MDTFIAVMCIVYGVNGLYDIIKNLEHFPVYLIIQTVALLYIGITHFITTEKKESLLKPVPILCVVFGILRIILGLDYLRYLMIIHYYQSHEMISVTSYIWLVIGLFIGCALLIKGIQHYKSNRPHRTTAKERNAMRKAKLQGVFSELSIGTPFSTVANKLGECEAVSTANLVSEVILENGVNRKVYMWYLDWDYVVSKSSGGVVLYNYANGNSMGAMGGKTTRKAFIQMVFEDNKLVAKEQQGLYE